MIKRNAPVILLLLLVLTSGCITFCYILSMRYELKTSAVDGLSFAQLLFNVISGNGLTTSIPPPYIEQNWLGIHFSPILYLLVPVYYLFPHIETLLFIQSFCIAASAIPIFFIAKTLLKSPWYALAVSIFYLINPFVINAQIWDFHEIAFAPLVIAMILWSIIHKEKIYFIIFCSIMLAIKEHYGLAVFGAGILWAHHWREPKFGLSVAFSGLIFLAMVIGIIMPHFSPLGSALMLSNEKTVGFFSWLNHPFADSDLLVKQVVNGIFYGIVLILPLWFQPLLSFSWLLPSIADMATNTLSINDLMRSPQSYHTAAIIPVLLIAYVKTLADRYSTASKLKIPDMLIATAALVGFFSYNFAALPNLPNNAFELSKFKFSLPPSDKSAHDEIIKIIGPDSSVSGPMNILPQIPVRRNMYLFPDRYEDADYIVINTRIIFEKRTAYFTEKHFQVLQNILADKNWGLVFYSDNWLLFKHNGQNNSQLSIKAAKDLQELQFKTKEHNQKLLRK